jgi:hypothetical protein
MGVVLIQTSEIIASCRDFLKWTGLCRGSTWIHCSSIVIVRGSAGILRGSVGIHRGFAGLHRGSAGIHRGSTVALPAISCPGSSPVCAGRATVLPGVTPIVPGRAKDEAGKAILPGSSRTTPVILNILFHPGSNAGCSRIIPDVTDVHRMFPVVPRSFPDHPGRLPGLCRDAVA